MFDDLIMITSSHIFCRLFCYSLIYTSEYDLISSNLETTGFQGTFCVYFSLNSTLGGEIILCIDGLIKEYTTNTVFCLISAPGALARSHLIVGRES